MKEQRTSNGSLLPPVVGLVLSSMLTVYLAVAVGRPVYLMVGLLTVAACLYWLVLGRKSTLDVVIPAFGNTAYLLLNLVFMALFALSLLLFATRPEPYIRPTSYFVTVSVMAVVVSIEIVFTMNSIRRACFALPKIVALGLSLVFTQSLMFPGVLGVDPWWHQMFTSMILESGHIPEGYFYSGLPIFHVEVASTSLLLDQNYMVSALLSISSFQIIVDVLFVYLLGRILFSGKVGALAALFLVTSSYFVNMGFWTIPNTVGVALIPCILYLLIQSGKSASYPAGNAAISLILMFVLILTHTVAAGGLAICLLIGWIAFREGSRISCYRMKERNTYVCAVPYSVGLVGWWAYASGHFVILVFLFQSGFSKEPFQIAPTRVVDYSSMVVEFEQIFNWLGLSLFFSLSFIGLFFMISRKRGSSHIFAIAAMGIISVAIPFISMTTGHRVYEHRFWYLALVILCLPLAVYFVLSLNMLMKRVSKMLFLSASVFSVVFLMIMCPTANIDNSVLSPNSSVRFALYESELHAGNSGELFNKTIYTDFYYTAALHWSGISAQSMDDQLLVADFTEPDDVLILLRDEIALRPFWLYGALWKMNYDPELVLDSTGFCRCYDCGTVIGYYRVV